MDSKTRFYFNTGNIICQKYGVKVLILLGETDRIFYDDPYDFRFKSHYKKRSSDCQLKEATPILFVRVMWSEIHL